MIRIKTWRLSHTRVGDLFEVHVSVTLNRPRREFSIHNPRVSARYLTYGRGGMITLMPPGANRLLKSLSRPEMERVKDNCQLVYLKSEQELWRQSDELAVAYMPLSAVISLLQTMSDGLAIEVASVGSEGIVGVPLFLGSRRSISQAVCQVPGECLMITDGKLREATDSIPRLHALIHRYTYVLLRQVVQAAGCNSLHSAEDYSRRAVFET